jgi:hypothetical protein
MFKLLAVFKTTNSIHTQILEFESIEEAETALREMNKGNAVTPGFNKELSKIEVAMAISRLYRNQ